MNTKQFEAVKYGLGFDYSIHGVDEYDKYAVLVLLAPRDGVYNFVLEKRDSQIRQGGEICFPGGKAESEDAGFEHTALRETFEEIGIPPDSIEIVGRLATMLAPRGLSIEPFIGVASSLDVLSINLEEVAQLIVLPISYFMNNEPERHAVRVQLLPRGASMSRLDRILRPKSVAVVGGGFFAPKAIALPAATPTRSAPTRPGP